MHQSMTIRAKALEVGQGGFVTFTHPRNSGGVMMHLDGRLASFISKVLDGVQLAALAKESATMVRSKLCLLGLCKAVRAFLEKVGH
jgi:hypothetical protein